MTSHDPAARLWAPRHRGWKLAHHLLPAFILVAVLLGAGVWGLTAQEWLLSSPLLALGVGVGWSIVREYRRGGADEPPATAAVVTSTGRRAATRFATTRASAYTGGLTVGVAVVTLVSALALGADTLTEYDGAAHLPPLLAAVMLLGVGVIVTIEGVRMLKLSAEQPPGVYLTRSRIVLVGQAPTAELFWKDVTGVRAEDPAKHGPLGQRHPLGERGPSRIVVRHRPGGGSAEERLTILVQYLTCDPNLLLASIEHYAATPADRPRLGTDAALAA
ncbi:hypothetical protein [Zhihengliuella salsuginis]|uniref:PH domain-containing protein n=1 Tax=Zhihengliuella salsuginis TaxID=578222 RepID=A0ABQ3GGL7_9MICC|nr:hypothetical protein [Zhihengliuella salsuginis]GHD05447.1 hypothetical protein GCM10008096_14360 [Zhihengliuella salsuginis]